MLCSHTGYLHFLPAGEGGWGTGGLLQDPGQQLRGKAEEAVNAGRVFPVFTHTVWVWVCGCVCVSVCVDMCVCAGVGGGTIQRHGLDPTQISWNTDIFILHKHIIAPNYPALSVRKVGSFYYRLKRDE